MNLINATISLELPLYAHDETILFFQSKMPSAAVLVAPLITSYLIDDNGLSRFYNLSHPSKHESLPQSVQLTLKNIIYH